MNTKWSAAEDNFLREKYGVLSKAEIGDKRQVLNFCRSN